MYVWMIILRHSRGKWTGRFRSSPLPTPGLLTMSLRSAMSCPVCVAIYMYSCAALTQVTSLPQEALCLVARSVTVMAIVAPSLKIHLGFCFDGNA